jgi:ATP phosphoribosyltransferase regulatory subunit
MTTPIARVVSSLYKEVALPIRLFYQANVFRAQEKEAGRNAEFFQTGVELIGDASVDADAEAIALAVYCLQAASVSPIKIAIGHVDFLDGLLDEIIVDVSVHERLRRFLHDRDYVSYRHLADTVELGEQDRRRLHAILSLRGGKAKIAEARELTVNGKARKAVQNLELLWQALEAYGVTEHVLLDFNLISNLNYYTGVVFEGYAADLGSPLVTGGRYDNLLDQFGRPAPATGFAIKMDRLMQVTAAVLEQQAATVVIGYSAANRRQAVTRAQELRMEGKAVITHLLNDSETLAVFEQRGNCETIYLLD